jgi:CelD/BcsL family acetyltransferase involved in cellulose biosynthesis
LCTPAEWRAPDVQEQWKALCRASGHLDVLYQSPEWFEHLIHESGGAGQLVAAIYDGHGARVGLVPIRRHHVDLDFVIGARVLGRSRLDSFLVLGAEPLLPPEPAAYECLLAALSPELGRDHCINFPMLARDTFCRRFLDQWLTAHRDFFVYAPAIPGAGETHSLRLDVAFDKYLAAQFNSKQRNNIKRRVKLLQERLGPLHLAGCRAPDEVAAFLAASRPVSEASWQYATVGPHFEADVRWEDKLQDLARRGVLRSYVLFAGERACAFVLGYQHSGVFYHVKTGYDRSLAKLAPGIVLLYLLIEELARDPLPVEINFGFGDADYKREFGNVHAHSDELLLLPRTLRNLARWGAHASYRAGVTFVRDQLRRLAPQRRPTAAPAAKPDEER